MGAYPIALILSSVIYGVTCLQVYIYFTESSGKNRPALKAFVRGHGRRTICPLSYLIQYYC
jgi:hypothetical protein